MHVVIVGASHRTAPLSLLERLSVPPGELDEALARLCGVVEEVFVLSTCNRTEIYAVSREPARDVPLLREFLVSRGGAATEIARSVYAYMDGDAVRHALRVASGLESMVLGEDQIQAQMKRALAAARGAEVLGATLERLGAAALSCGKRVRTFTGVGHHAVSLESLAVDAARRQLGGLEERSIVVLGSGNSAGIVARLLRDAGARTTVVGRTHGAASALAHDAGIACEAWEHMPDMLAPADAVFCCTSAPHPVLTADTLAVRLARRPGVPLLCVDLGMPRDIDESAAASPGISVIALAQLASMADAHRDARRQHLPAALAIVDRETARYLEWLTTRRATTDIAALHTQATAVVDAEVKRALARLQTSSAHDRAVVAELARRIARALTHEQTASLKFQLEMDAAVERGEVAS